MKRILILSDTHRQLTLALKIIPLMQPDAIIHLGDCISDATEIEAYFPDIKVYMVAGNNDFSMIDCEKVYTLFGKRFYCAHGHTLSLERGISRAKEEKCDVYLFGHTHMGFCETKDNILCLNPGSISRPRDNDFSFGIIEIEDDKIKGCVCPAQGY